MPNTYEDPAIAQQRRLSQALLERGMNPQSIDGHYRRTNQAADLVSILAGTVGAQKADERQAADDESYRKTIADALTGPQNEQQPGFVGPKQDQNEYLVKALAGNKRTAPMALEYQMKRRMADAENEAQLRQALALAEARKNAGLDTPSDILSFREVEKMTPEQRELFFQTKRGAQIKEVGGVPSVISGREVTPLSSLEKEAAAAATKEGAKTTAKETAELRVAGAADLPRVVDNAGQMHKLLDKLEKSDLGLIYGASALVPIVPGTPQADVYSDWEQLQGKAFLEAFNSLKGGGQITEIEGQKATSAITSLSQRRQTPKKAKEAIAELREVISAGVKRAQSKAGVASGAGGLTPEEQREYEELKRRFGR